VVRLESTIKRFVGRSSDDKPRPGQEGADGITPAVADVPPGSTFLDLDTGGLYRWDGTDWILPSVEDATVALLGELLQEMRAVRVGIELQLLLTHDVKIDLKTETVLELQET
jgi:hypothetical protein